MTRIRTESIREELRGRLATEGREWNLAVPRLPHPFGVVLRAKVDQQQTASSLEGPSTRWLKKLVARGIEPMQVLDHRHHRLVSGPGDEMSSSHDADELALAYFRTELDGRLARTRQHRGSRTGEVELPQNSSPSSDARCLSDLPSSPALVVAAV